MKYYIIGWGLNGGFGGINEYEVIKAESLEKADKDAYQRACESFEDYSGMHGIRSFQEIMDENGFEEGNEADEAYADEEYNEERESWLDYSAEEYTKTRGDLLWEDYNMHNPYIKEISCLI